MATPTVTCGALGFQQVREELPGSGATKKLAALLPKLPPESQVGLLDALGERGDRAARQAVLQMLQSKTAAVRAAALRALGLLGTTDDVALLAKRATGDSKQETAAAQQSLIRLRGDGVNQAVLAALAKGGPGVKVALLDVLAARNAKAALPQVLAAAKSSEPAIRTAALRALRFLADEKQTAAVVALLKAAKSDAERRAAELALLAICNRGREKCVTAIEAGLAGADAPAQKALLRALGRAGGDKALAALLTQLQAEEAAVRDEAMRVLSLWPDAAATRHLLQIAKSTDSLRHRVLAIRGLVRQASPQDGKPADKTLLSDALKQANRPQEARSVKAVLDPSAAPVEVPEPSPQKGSSVSKRPGSMKLVPLPLELPAAAFRGTPVPQKEPNLEKPRGTARPPFLAPAGTVNLSRGKPVFCSDLVPNGGEIDFVTDGDKEASDFGALELGPGRQWVQIDLGQRSVIYAVLLWHNHAEARVYRDVVVQVSDDPDFLEAFTVFNNDYDNSSGLGIGKDKGTSRPPKAN